MRHIPIFTFINKMDRDAKDPFDLLEELEQELGIEHLCQSTGPSAPARNSRASMTGSNGHIAIFLRRLRQEPGRSSWRLTWMTRRSRTHIGEAPARRS